MKNISNVVLYKAQQAAYPSENCTYRPFEEYPEYLFHSEVSSQTNHVYDAVRQTLYLMGLDKEKYGSNQWNPLGQLILPGNKVLIKPNLVMDFNKSGKGTECLYTHPSVVAAIIDYTLIALKGKGKIVIGDAPMQECDFNHLIEESGYGNLVQFYKKKGIDISLIDFRELKTETKMGAKHQKIQLTSEGTVIDLKDESEFSIYDKNELDRLRITNYSPDRLKTHHANGKHEYYVSNEVLKADVVINVPKPKTHRKAGVTIALKNLVGINVRKEYLPHHMTGSSEEGGDEYIRKSALRRFSSYLYDKKNMYEGQEKYFRARIIYAFAYGIKGLTHYLYKDEVEGSWYGNNTISKTIVDLNKILLYADKNGIIHDSQQRKILNIADMIISGEKEGPVAPSPKEVGYIVAGYNSVNVDKVVASMMGADITQLPTIKNAVKINGKLQIKAKEEPIIVSNNDSLNNKKIEELTSEDKWNFVCTKGWKRIFEK